jgi:hypothetical protein
MHNGFGICRDLGGSFPSSDVNRGARFDEKYGASVLNHFALSVVPLFQAAAMSFRAPFCPDAKVQKIDGKVQ